jgi:phage terminase small subunit
MPRNLSARQLKFAAAIAAGETQAAAYTAAGFAPNSSPKTAARDARRLAQKGEVRAAIEKMQLQLLPDPGDVRGIRAHAMGVIVRLSLEAEDEKVKLQAARWLHEETGRQIAERERLEKIQQQSAPRRESDAEIIAELRMLYAKALPSAPESELLEAVSDGTADGQPGEATAENLPQVAELLAEVAASAEPTRAEDEAPEPGENATVDVSSGAEKLNPAVQYRRERIPGYFPAKYRRVPIEP